MSNILVINLARLGDIVQAAPMLLALKQTHPDASITMLVNRRFSEICKLMPWVDETVELDFNRAGRHIAGENACIETAYDYIKHFYEALKLKRFNSIINITPHYIGIFSAVLSEDKKHMTEQRSDWPLYYINATRHWNTLPYHMADLYTKIAGLAPAAAPARLHVDAATAQWAKEFLREQGYREGMLLIGFHTGASTREKQWPLEYFIELGEKIISTLHAKIILYGSAVSQDIHSRFNGACINAQGRTSISQLAALLRQTSILVTNDTGPMHIAAACGTRVISLHMGKEMCRTTGPYGPDCIAVQPRLDCHPCEHPEKCQQRTCQRRISPTLIYALVRSCCSGAKQMPCDAVHVNSEQAEVFVSQFDGKHLLDYYPCARRGLNLDAMCYRLLRIVWDHTLTGRHCPVHGDEALFADVQGLVAALRNYYSFTAIDRLARQWQLLHIYLETIEGYCAEGVELSRAIEKSAAAPGINAGILQQLARRIEALDGNIIGQGAAAPPLATLTHMFIVEKEHLAGDDIAAQARHTRVIYENLQRRCRLMRNAGGYFLDCCTEHATPAGGERSAADDGCAAAYTTAA